MKYYELSDTFGEDVLAFQRQMAREVRDLLPAGVSCRGVALAWTCKDAFDVETTQYNACALTRVSDYVLSGKRPTQLQ